MESSTVAFVGLGYIGLPTAVVLANSGVKVVGVDIDPQNVARINSGEVPIVEPGLEEGLQKALASGNFSATTEMIPANAFIVAVPTPFDENRNIDLKYIYAVADSIAPKLEGGELIILESTSPPGTTNLMAKRILDQRPDLNADEDANPASEATIYFAHCPERILPGHAMEELITNDRIIGGCSSAATQRAKEIYKSFCVGDLLETNATTAELAKLTENSFRDVNIAFANELSLICDRLGVDVWELIELANHHPRVNILQPGPGVGGHCIAVDPWFIVSADRENSRLIKTARIVNDSKPVWVVEKVSEAFAEVEGAEPTIATLGLSFKPDIDDLRESPAVAITQEIASRFPNITILSVEPHIRALPDSFSPYPNIHLSTVDEAIQRADIIVALVDHSVFKKIELSRLQDKVLVDTKGLWN